MTMVSRPKSARISRSAVTLSSIQLSSARSALHSPKHVFRLVGELERLEKLVGLLFAYCFLGFSLDNPIHDPAGDRVELHSRHALGHLNEILLADNRVFLDVCFLG